MPTSPAALDVSFSLDEEFSRAPPTMTGEPDKPPREEQPIPFFPTPVAIVPNARVADGRYHVINVLGKGGVGIVFRAVDRVLNTYVALKVVRYSQMARNDNLSRRLLAETNIMRNELVGAPSTIVRLLDTFVQAGAHAQNHSLVLVIQYVEGRNLLDVISGTIAVGQQGLNEETARAFFRDLLSAVLYLHDNNLTHRDIKPENLMIEELTGRCKLIDFGLAKHITSAQTLGIGTPGFAPPEAIYRKDPSTGQYLLPKESYSARKVDSWAMGATLYLMLEAAYPFDLGNTAGRDVAGMLRAQMSGSLRPMRWFGEGTVLRDLIVGMLRPDPEARFSLEEIRGHPWVAGAPGRDRLEIAKRADFGVSLRAPPVSSPPSGTRSSP